MTGVLCGRESQSEAGPVSACVGSRPPKAHREVICRAYNEVLQGGRTVAWKILSNFAVSALCWLLRSVNVCSEIHFDITSGDTAALKNCKDIL